MLHQASDSMLGEEEAVRKGNKGGAFSRPSQPLERLRWHSPHSQQQQRRHPYSSLPSLVAHAQPTRSCSCSCSYSCSCSCSLALLLSCSLALLLLLSSCSCHAPPLPPPPPAIMDARKSAPLTNFLSLISNRRSLFDTISCRIELCSPASLHALSNRSHRSSNRLNACMRSPFQPSHPPPS